MRQCWDSGVPRIHLETKRDPKTLLYIHFLSFIKITILVLAAMYSDSGPNADERLDQDVDDLNYRMVASRKGRLRKKAQPVHYL